MNQFIYKYNLHFAGLFLFYVLIIFFRNSENFIYDESRFYGYALHLLEGRYAMNSDGFIWNGPGFPIVIAPFVALGAKGIGLRLLNAFFLTGAVYYFNGLLKLTNIKNQLRQILVLVFALYPGVLLFSIHTYMTEVFCIFLLTGILYFYFKFYIEKRHKYLIISTLLGAFLILTKVIFFYVFLLISAIFLIVSFKFSNLKSSFKLVALQLLMILPYLFYTYSQTEKFPFLANAGGMQIYWMTVSGKNHTGEWHPFPGDWNPYPESSNLVWSVDKNYPAEVWYQENLQIINEWKKLKPIDADHFLLKQSRKNIWKQPSIFFKNIGYNISRFYFDKPRDGKWSINLFKLTNFISILGFFATLSVLFKTLQSRVNTVYLYPALVLIIYTFASFLLSAYMRFSFVILPISLLMIGLSIGFFIKKEKDYDTQ